MTHTQQSAGLVERLDMIADAIERAQCPGREGPYGGYDYSDYGWEQPYRVRDFRDPRSDTYGGTVFKTDDRAASEEMFRILTRRHIALAALTAATTPTADEGGENV